MEERSVVRNVTRICQITSGRSCDPVNSVQLGVRFMERCRRRIEDLPIATRSIGKFADRYRNHDSAVLQAFHRAVASRITVAEIPRVPDILIPFITIFRSVEFILT